MHLDVSVVIFDRKEHYNLSEGMNRAIPLSDEANGAVAVFEMGSDGKSNWRAYNNTYVLKDGAPTYERVGVVGLNSITIGDMTNQGSYAIAKEIL